MSQHSRRSLVILVPMFVFLAGGMWFGQNANAQPEPGSAIKKFMRAKLTNAQRVLEGLCVEDFGLILKATEELETMSRAAEWQVIPGPEYAQLSGEFRRAVDQLKKAAKEKNLDSCRLFYLKTTMSCLECHHFVRSTRVAGGPELKPWNENGVPRLVAAHAPRTNLSAVRE